MAARNIVHNAFLSSILLAVLNEAANSTTECPGFDIPYSQSSCSASPPGTVCKPKCYQGFELEGSPSKVVSTTCQPMGNWSHPKPRCIPMGDCDFKDGSTCAWIQETTTDNFDWRVMNDPKSNSKPLIVPASSDGGEHLLMETINRSPGETATLEVKDLKLNTSLLGCFGFKYYMDGRDNEILKIYQDNHTLFSASGPQERSWKKAVGKLFTTGQIQSSHFRIIGTVGHSDHGYIAIDKIRFLPGNKCQNITCPGFSVANVQSSCPVSVVPGTECKLNCEEGFELDDYPSNSLKCLPMGTWSHPMPSCLSASISSRLGEIIGITVGCSIVFILLLVFVIICCLRCRKRRRAPDSEDAKYKVEYQHDSPVEEPAVVETDEWEVDSNNVTFLNEVAHGAFGRVFKAILKKPSLKEETIVMAKLMGTPQLIRKNRKEEVVALKTLPESVDQDQKSDFLKEIKMMKKLGYHPNIVNFLYCNTTSEPYFLVVEYLPRGDLLNYLRTHRHKISEIVGKELAPVYFQRKSFITVNVKIENEVATKCGATTSSSNESTPQSLEMEDDALTPKVMMSFSYQIAAGMEYLANKGFVHRDLAARNVLVADNKQVKVSDFGLTRDLYEESVYHARVQRRLPIKWMSPEAIYDQVFTTDSDVWSYGILLWEILTLGGAPYPSMSLRDLLQELRNGYRMEKPDMCSDEVYNIMKKCWEANPSDRPTFTTIVKQFEALLQKDHPYLDFNDFDSNKDYYLVPSFDSAEEESCRKLPKV